MCGPFLYSASLILYSEGPSLLAPKVFQTFLTEIILYHLSHKIMSCKVLVVEILGIVQTHRHLKIQLEPGVWLALTWPETVTFATHSAVNKEKKIRDFEPSKGIKVGLLQASSISDII